MLVLSRQRDETIKIGELIDVTIVAIKGDRVRVGISAPPDVPVHRKEVYDEIREKQGEQAVSAPHLAGDGTRAMYRGPASAEVNRLLNKQVEMLEEAARKGMTPDFPERYRDLCEELLEVIQTKTQGK